MKTQPITIDNLVQVLEFNGFVAENSLADFYYAKGWVAIFWDNNTVERNRRQVCFKQSGVYYAFKWSDLDLFLIALERQGVKLKPLPVEPVFDFKQYLLDSELFRLDEMHPNMFVYYKINRYYSNLLRIDNLDQTKENADKLIEIAKLFEQVK